MLLHNIASMVIKVPLLISPEKLQIILSVISDRIGIDSSCEFSSQDNNGFIPYMIKDENGDNDGNNDDNEYNDSIKDDSNDNDNGCIAVIPVHGTLVHRQLGINAVSGITSYQEIHENIKGAINNSKVKGIILDIDSSGGEVDGVFELADFIRSASEDKPIWAVANSRALSAAYAIASATGNIYVSKTSNVGSIGVIAIHVDQSNKNIKDGYNFTAIYSGSHKNDFSPHEPLSEDGKKLLQNEIDKIYKIFVEAVSDNRKTLTVNDVINTNAKTYFGDDSITEGLADNIGTLNDAINDMKSSINVEDEVDIVSKKSESSISDTVAISEVGEDSKCDNKAAINAKVSEQKYDNSCSDIEMKLSDIDDKIKNARAEERMDVQAIVELCAIAKQPNLASAFVSKGMTSAEVRHELINLMADEPEINSYIAPNYSAEKYDNVDFNNNPLLKTIRKRQKLEG